MPAGWVLMIVVILALIRLGMPVGNPDVVGPDERAHVAAGHSVAGGGL